MKKILLTLLCALLPLLGWAQENEPYAVLSKDNTVLTFYYDGHKAERNGLSVGPFGLFWDETLQSSVPNQSWSAERKVITTIVFDASFAACTTIPSTSCWFCECSNLSTISGMENLNTSNVTDMWGMFSGCSGLTSIDVSGFKTENVTNMGSMFAGCSSLTSIDVSGFKTENVTNMGSMFAGCSGLTSIDVSGFKTENVTFMGSMFWGCSGLTSIDVSGFKTDKVTHMNYMFAYCSSLTSLDLSSFNTEKVIGMDRVFWHCSGLTSLDLSNFNTSSVTNMYGMFAFCSGLTSLDVSGFNTDNVTNMGEMFRNCSSLTSLDVSSFKMDNVTSMTTMFTNCRGLTSLDVSGFKTDNVKDMGCVFDGCSGLTSLDLSSFNTENVTDMKYMFRDCEGLTTIYVDEGWSTSAVTSGDGMFTNCYNLVGGKGTKYNYIHDDYTYARIDQGSDSEAPGYFTRSGDIPWGERATFDGRVLTVRGSGSIDAALTQVGGFELVDKTITAIVWEADVPYSGEAAFSNPNLLFYANDATKGQAVNNLIYNGMAESITLTDEGEGNTDFYCPQSFTARSITYRRSFQQQTEIGVSRGWETIALPFTVQRISRVRSGGEGQDNITPFGSSEGDRHFWLRRLTANGLQGVQAIEANTPYIIAMPNSEEYAAEYNLAGDIVFTAENATVAVTEPVSDRSADYELTANFERMAAQDSIYVLNVGAPRYGYPEGSLFEAAYRDLQPFRAYTRHINSGRPAPPYFALGNLGGDTTTGISSVSDDAFATDTWYDIQGRKLQGRPTQKGVYIHNGRKVIVRQM